MQIPLQDSAYIDLHIHSTASDGSLTPVEIIETAKKAGLRAIAITDHDTLDGSVEALQYQHSSGIEILPGIEISANFDFGTMHILGYLIRLDDVSLRQTLKVIQEGRASRNIQIIKRLQGLGIDISHDEVSEASGGGQIGRPHIAQVLVNKRIVQNIDEAFNKFLRKGRPAYVKRYRLAPAEAIQAILRAGGVPVLAHPFTLNEKTEGGLDRILADLKQDGLKGVEVYYPDHGPDLTAQYQRLAHRHELLMTGGTDFHGTAKPGVYIGIGKGELRIPYRLVEALKQSASQTPS
ncbi:MAG: PHP domain-containing protein [Deltaproteobacteria bacterium]|nr:PHP domain-containing protein [Deltaproteobacteria bacterium]MBW2019238.1 PHP domain-containing protein [Deltaproteobacteria bacterium]MBW2074044.1 PHP domain-containing protein [Deltaproteobacteria bacterium]RLB82487.1 MAG: phosphoesterase [Deltaproteobacteria bacterium]